MTIKIGLPQSDSVVDREFVEVSGPDGIVKSFQYDSETNSFITKESQVIIPAFHGHTHVTTDPIPESSPFLRGLMSAEDKARLDSMTQTRLGVLGFQGAGFPDDGGWMQGDIIFAAGSEFISIERVGNVVRFTVDSPIPLSCNCFTDGCRVLMGNGTYKNIEDVCIGDNVITHAGKVQKVTKVMKEPYNDKILDIKVLGHNDKFSVTPGHAIYSLSERINSRRTSLIRDNTGVVIRDIGVSWALSHDLNENDFVVSRHCFNDVSGIDSIVLSDYYSGIYLINDGIIYPARISRKGNKFIDGMAKGVPNCLDLDGDLMKLFGYYLAEGCCSKKNGIRFTVHRSEMKAGEIGSDIVNIVKNKFGIEPKIQNKPSCINAVDIQFFSNILVDLFSKWFNTRSFNKYIPEWLLSIHPDLQYHLLVGFIKGDGTKFSNGDIRIEVASQDLTDQIKFIADRCGLHFTSFAKRNINGNKSSTIIYDNISFVASHNKKLVKDVSGIDVNEAKTFNYLKKNENKLHKISKITEKHHDGYVYNLEVENDHSYVVNGIVVHNCEECAQIYWIQDESESRSVRPPSCNGIMPDVNGYGNFTIYAYPENQIFNPNRPNDFFEQKGMMPTITFRRYQNGNEPNTAEHHSILKRRDDLTTNVGWSMTPGSNGIPEAIWYVGSDREGRQIEIEMMQEQDPGLIGAILYNGATITRRNAIITGYDDTVIDTNLYKVKMWQVEDEETIGDEFIAQNIWRYNNPENGDATPTSLVLDKTVQLLSIGDIVELYQFTISNVNGSRTFKSYFSKKPNLNPAHVWAYSNGIRFGDLLESRDDINHAIGVTGTGTEKEASIKPLSDIRLFEHDSWGITNYENDLLLPDDGSINSINAYEPGGTLINNNIQAVIDNGIPGLRIEETPRDTRGDINDDGVVDEDDLNTLMGLIGVTSSDLSYDSKVDLNNDGVIDVKDLGILATNMNVNAVGTSDRPIWLWDRQNHGNFLMKMKVGLPTEDIDSFPPIDIITGGPIDSNEDVYMRVVERGIYETGPFQGMPYIVVVGSEWNELPSRGVLRILTGVYRDIVWKYNNKIFDGDRTILVGTEDIFPFDEDYIQQYSGTDVTAITVSNVTDVTADDLVAMSENTVVAQLLHEDYTSPAVRLSFSINRTPDQESVQLQVLAGTLSMSTAYKLDDPDDFQDDFVRGFLPGEFTVSDSFIQTGFISDGIGADVESNPDNFRVYNGGFLPAPVGGSSEKWNELMVMKRGSQLWIWWNNFLITPSKEKSAELPTPVAVTTPYFPISSLPIGKMGLRMFPGAVIREIEVRDENEGFNEFMLGQLKINC